jgi:hypothetical protein
LRHLVKLSFFLGTKFTLTRFGIASGDERVVLMCKWGANIANSDSEFMELSQRSRSAARDLRQLSEKQPDYALRLRRLEKELRSASHRMRGLQ